jgi:hypothetical protein
VKKILYATANKLSSYTQYERFAVAIKDKDYSLKLASFYGGNYNYDFNIGYMKSLGIRDDLSIHNKNLQDYYDFIKRFSPDIIITDAEVITAHIAFSLNIKTINVSSSLIRVGVPQFVRSRGNLVFYSSHNQNENYMSNHKYIAENSDLNLIYSPLADLGLPTNDNFKWTRPYHLPLSKFKSGNIAIFTNSDKKDLIKIRNLDVDVIHTPSYNEHYEGFELQNPKEYDGCPVNAKYLVSNGQADYVADALYNGKIPIIFPDYTQDDSRYAACMNEAYKISSTYYHDRCVVMNKPPKIKRDPSIKYLHEYLEDLL